MHTVIVSRNMQAEECLAQPCDICGTLTQHILKVGDVVMLAEQQESLPQYHIPTHLDICEECVHVMYAKCCATFNVRPKLW